MTMILETHHCFVAEETIKGIVEGNSTCFLKDSSLTLFYTRDLGITVLHVMVPQPYGPPPPAF
jgi:hypothetical protein